MVNTIQDKQANETTSFREELVVASMFYESECRKHFSNRPLNPQIFQDKQLCSLVRGFNDVNLIGGVEPTETLIVDQLNPKDEPQRQRIFDYLHKLKSAIQTEPLEAVDIHVKILKKQYLNRSYQQLGYEIIEKTNHVNVTDLMEKNVVEQYIENMLFHLSQLATGDDEEQKRYTLTEGTQMTINAMNQSLESESAEAVPTGYRMLDEALEGGWKKGNFALIAARPGMGKTVWMLNSAVEAAKKGVKTLFISIEMPAIQLFQRVIAKLSDTTMSQIQRPELMQPKDWTRLTKAAQDIVAHYGDNFFVEETTDVTIPQLERIVKHYVKTHGVEVVFVDYAQIMLNRDGDQPKESSDFDEISGGLRRIAKKLNVAMVVGSQLNRKVEERDDKRPIMSDIRNSGAFEQDAGVIIALYRDEQYYKEESEKPNIIELIFLKNRFGNGTATIEFGCDLSRQKIMAEAPHIQTAA